MKTAGRAIAIIMIAQAGIAPVVNFVLIRPVMTPPGFLINAATHAAQMRLAAMLWLSGATLSIALAAVAVSVIRRFSDPMATWLESIAQRYGVTVDELSVDRVAGGVGAVNARVTLLDSPR